MAVSTSLQAIITNVRKITQRPSASQISDADLTNLINTVMLFDLPEDVRLQNLHGTLVFYTQPYQDKYVQNTTDVTNPLYNLLQVYYTFNGPLYVGGYNTPFFQDKNSFTSAFNPINSQQLIGYGDGSTTVFTGSIPQLKQTIASQPQNVVIVKDSVVVSGLDGNNNAMVLIDYPVSVNAGTLAAPKSTVTPPVSTTNFINYLTGQYSITFSTPPGNSTPIYIAYLPYTCSIPTGILWYDNTFIMRPVPDKVYKISIEAFLQPAELINTTDTPLLQEWFQFVTYLAAEKVCELYSDHELLDSLKPITEKYRKESLRRTLVQLATTRSKTIYEQQVEGDNSTPFNTQGYW